MTLNQKEREAGLISTAGYYEREAKAVAERTLPVDLSSLYAPFLGMLPPEAHILDAGCGAGRDSLYFLQRGYQVTAFDASTELVSLAASFTGLPVRHQRFQEFQDQQAYDGIWACASLLHVSRDDMPDVLARLTRALKLGGVLYASFRYGSEETLRGELYFNDCNEPIFNQWLGSVADLELVYAWLTEDSPPRRVDVTWFNALVEKTRRPISE
jgi:SAM-dependent methyltransferase